MTLTRNYSDYIVYVDESGDHGLANINPSYPLFVLSFCIFRKQAYIEEIVPALQTFKFNHFGHDQVVLHESDIHHNRRDFSFLKNEELKTAFKAELYGIIEQAPFSLICTAIRKKDYLQRYPNPNNPYHVALGYGLERVFYYLREQRAHQVKTHIIVEKRGKVEDDELELEFRRICDGENYRRETLPFEVVFADKKSNSIGLQLADLTARPVGIHLLHPQRPNRAFEILQPKFYGGDKKNGRGLKCFPQ